MAYELDPAAISRLRRHGVITSIEAGEFLFQEGDPGDALYIVLSGVLRIEGGDTVYETVKAGGIVGEMGIVSEGYPRSASAVALARCELLRIDREAFLSLVAADPGFALNLMRICTHRLRVMNRRYLHPRRVAAAQTEDEPVDDTLVSQPG